MRKIFLLFLVFSLLIAPFQVWADENTQQITSSTEEIATGKPVVVEPIIRVGLYKTKNSVKIVSEVDLYIITGENLVGVLPSGETATLSYTKGTYFLKSDSLKLESDNFWRVLPSTEDGYFDLPGCGRILSGRKMVYCSYRGILEYRFSPKSNMPYIINELPLEDYMKGIAETDNNSDEDYIKAVLVAARSYAYTFIGSEPATEKRLFDVYANTNDQLYLGYTSEMTMPKVAQFAQDTAGLMVTYNGKVVMTQYFSRSNGQTRTWKNSKGINDRPWLTSVECKYDKGKSRLGHGYGMSTGDALLRATKDGLTFTELLAHYYTNTRLEKIY